MKSQIEILGLGCVAVDELIYVDAYPPPDAKVRVLRTTRQCGGLTATALVAAARLGARCAYAGVLGKDELSRFTIERMREEGINLKHLIRRPDAGPVHSFIIVDEHGQTRNIFADVRTAIGADDLRPNTGLIQSICVLLVDSFGMKGMIRAARLARAKRIAVVGDFDRGISEQFLELLNLVDHLIIGWSFAQQLTSSARPASAAKMLWNAGRKVVVVTCGGEGCWYFAGNGAPQHQPAFRVPAVDTTGCGDVFHGAYAAALARGMELRERIRFASASAALKATKPGGQAGIPMRTEVEEFLKLNR